MARFAALGVNGHGRRIGRRFIPVLKVDDRRGVSTAQIALSESILLLEIVSFMNLFDDLLVFVFYFLDFLFQIFELLMQMADLFRTPGVSVFIDARGWSDPGCFAHIRSLVALSKGLAHLKFINVMIRPLNADLDLNTVKWIILNSIDIILTVQTLNTAKN